MKIPALTLTQPWASLLAAGIKKNETRGWSTTYRGLLAIHASARYPVEAHSLELEEPFDSALQQLRVSRLEGLPLGAVLGFGVITSIKRIQLDSDLTALAPEELAFGDYTTGRYAWRIAHNHRLPVPLPAKGKQGLWTWETPADFVLPASLVQYMGRRAA